MPTFYEEMASIADGLLREFNQGDIRLTRTTRVAPDPSTPWIPGAAETRIYQLAGAVNPVQRKFVDGTTILMSDSQAVVSTRASLIAVNGSSVASSDVYLEPMPSDVVSVDGVDRTLLGVRRIPDAGTPVSYALILRM